MEKLAAGNSCLKSLKNNLKNNLFFFTFDFWKISLFDKTSRNPEFLLFQTSRHPKPSTWTPVWTIPCYYYPQIICQYGITRIGMRNRCYKFNLPLVRPPIFLSYYIPYHDICISRCVFTSTQTIWIIESHLFCKPYISITSSGVIPKLSANWLLKMFYWSFHFPVFPSPIWIIFEFEGNWILICWFCRDFALEYKYK